MSLSARVCRVFRGFGKRQSLFPRVLVLAQAFEVVTISKEPCNDTSLPSAHTHTHTHTHTLLAKSNELIHLNFELHYTPCEIIINY